jgi:hypothetical protein
MAATTPRRITKLEGSLSPTQLLVRWLTQAQQGYASFSAYAEYVNTTALANPMLWLPEQVAGWVRSQHAAGRAAADVDREIDRLVTATLGCVALVREVNAAIASGQQADQITLAFLEAAAPLVQAGSAGRALARCWSDQLTRLQHETALWTQVCHAVATRYFAGHPPLFAAEAATVLRLHHRVAALAEQQPRGRSSRRAAPQHQASTTIVANMVAQLVAGARAEVELVFGARPGLIYVQGRIAATRESRS